MERDEMNKAVRSPDVHNGEAWPPAPKAHAETLLAPGPKRGGLAPWAEILLGLLGGIALYVCVVEVGSFLLNNPIGLFEEEMKLHCPIGLFWRTPIVVAVSGLVSLKSKVFGVSRRLGVAMMVSSVIAALLHGWFIYFTIIVDMMSPA